VTRARSAGGGRAIEGDERSPDRRRRAYLGPWRVDTVQRSNVELPVAVTVLARAVGGALSASGAPSPGSVTVVLTDDEELTELNAEHMGVDGPTDVLSFPMLPPASFGRAGPKAGAASASVPRQAGAARRARTHIGDIAISVERAIDQAESGRGGQTGDRRWSPADELRLLATHGALHLCGWDHAEPADATAMRGLEATLLTEASGRVALRAHRATP
jgi:probable rRNA maturation factor